MFTKTSIMQEKIFIRQWLAMKPYSKQVQTDSYYLRLANKVRQVFAGRNYMVLAMYLNKEEVSDLACFLVSWFEDVISRTGIWKTFISMHEKQYGKKLPFYDITDYVEDEINKQDVAFLTWYFLNTMQKEKFISPYNDFIDNIATAVMDIFDKEYEIAYENNYLQALYTLDKDETDFYSVRLLVDRILFSSYLFFGDTHKGLMEKEAEVLEEYGNESDLAALLQEYRDWYLHTAHTRLMAAPGKLWAAEILGDSHPRSTDLRNMSPKIRGIFMYKGQDDTDVFLEHVASGKPFKLTKKSFDFSHQLTEPDSLLYIGIINWRNEWWFSGSFAYIGYDADRILDEKNSADSRAQVSFLDHPVLNTDEWLSRQAEAFKSYNSGSLIAFMTTDRMTSFAEGFMKYVNELNDAEADAEEAVQRARKEGFFGDKQEQFSGLPEGGDQGLVFFNPKAGLEMAYNVTSAFPLPENPWYNEAESEEDLMYLFHSPDISTELVYYCIENCSHRLPYFKKGMGKLLLNDIDFLLRFWKAKEYHSEKRVGYIGANG